jgi:two-component system sensor histidine kinase DesK
MASIHVGGTAMHKWYHIFQKNTGLSPYVWVVFYILPFYFIFSANSTCQVVFGVVMIIVFFACYVLSFISTGLLVYFWTSVQIVISLAMTLLFGYVYFSLFLAFFIGNIQNRAGFITLYTIHLVTTFAAINYGFAAQIPVFITQFPFILVVIIGVILLPINMYNKNKSDQLEGKLEEANKRISELVKLEERQRIARDLHDTMGQKLSLIGLKSDLAGKLVDIEPQKAKAEMKDVSQTARSALKEVREMVTEMRGMRLEDAIFRVEQILEIAEIDFRLEGDVKLNQTSIMNENVVSMCTMEAVTNIVKHSKAAECTISIEPSDSELVVRVQDNGVGLPKAYRNSWGSGIRGMKERLEFVNGGLSISSDNGTLIVITVPNILNQVKKEAEENDSDRDS